MNLLLLFSVFLLAANVRSEDDLALPRKCEDVLSAEQCQQLRDFAKAAQEKLTEIDEAVSEAVRNGKQRAQEIFESARSYITAKLQAKTCEDLLPAEYCAKLKEIGATLKLKAAELDNKIRALITKGTLKASEIYQQAKNYLDKILAIRTCEDVLSAEQCSKIRNAAASVRAKAEEVNAAIREAVARGRTRAAEIYEEALNFFRTRVLSKTCEDVLPAKTCAKLRQAAVDMREKADLVNEYVRRAILEGKTKANEVFERVRAYFQSLLNAKTCDDLIPGDTCDKLREFAEKVHVGAEKATQAVREAFEKGFHKASTATKAAIENIKHFAANAKCEDLISAQACATLRDTANKVKVGAEKVNEAVKDAIAKSIFYGEDLMKRARTFLKEEITCENVLGASTCAKIYKVAASIGVAMDEAERVIKDNIMKGMNRLSEVYNAVIQFLKDKVWEKMKSWVPSIGKRDLDKRGLTDLIAKAKAKVQASLEKAKELLAEAKAKALEALKNVRGKVKEVLAAAIANGKAKLDNIEQFVRELMEKYGTNGDELFLAKRAFIDDLKAAAQKAKDKIRELIDQALEKGSLTVQKLRGMLAGVVEKILGERQRREVNEDLDVMHDLLDMALKRETEEMKKESMANVDALFDEAFESIDDLADTVDDHSHSQKRQAESDLFLRLRETLDTLANNLY